MKIALIARPELIQKVDAMKNDFQGIDIRSFPYIEAKETPALINQAFMCDIYMFGETLPYLYVKKIVDKKRLPKVIIAFDEYKIISALYSLYYSKKQPLQRLSLDVYQDAVLKEVFAEMKIYDKDIYSYAYGDEETPDLEKIVQFHQELWKEKKIDHALTSINEVAERLTALHIPSSCMAIPSLNVKRALMEAHALGELNKNKSAQIVAGYVQIKNLAAIKNEQDKAAVKTLLLRLQQILFTFGKKTSASVMVNQDHQIVLFGTKGVLQHITNHYRDFPLLRELEEALHTSVEIGFGLGLT